ncbi:MAG: thiamine phosphate synthase [Nitrospirales bacterium]
MTSRVLPRLYVVTNRHQTRERPLHLVLNETLQSGTSFIQLREKDLSTHQLLTLAKDILTGVHQHKGLLLINDRIDIAKAIGADGVHLRSDSLPIQQARRILGSKAIIGKSTHSLNEVLAAETAGADFILLGPIYDTPSKRSYGSPLGMAVLTEACQQCSLPIYAIGGITPERIPELNEAGAYGIAAISAILESQAIPSVTKHFLDALERS